MTDNEYLRQRVDKVAEDQAAQNEVMKVIAEDCAEIKQCLKGNGQPGLVVRTDRLEQKEKTRSRLMWLIVSGVVALILNAIAGHIGFAF